MKNLLILSSLMVAAAACTPPMGREPLPANDVLQVVPGTARFTAGTPLQLGALRLKDSAVTNVTGQATWSSSNPAVVAVGMNTGTAALKQAGTATITASFDGKTGTCEVIVLGRVVSAEVGVGDVSIPVGITTSLGGILLTDDNRKTPLDGTETFGSSNSAVASVNATGDVTGEAPGTATISLTRDGRTYSRQVTVEATALMDISAGAVDPLFAATTTFPPERSLEVSVDGTFTNGAEEDVTGFFDISVPVDSGVANIDGTTVTAEKLDAGTKTIAVTFVGKDGGLAAGKRTTLTLTVNAAPLSAIRIAAPANASTKGESARLRARGVYGNLDGGGFIYPLSGQRFRATPPDGGMGPDDGGTVSIAGNGTVTWLTPGLVTFWTTVGPIEGTASTLVNASDLTGVTIGGAGPLAPGDSLALSASAAFGAATNNVTSIVVWKSSAPSIAEVSNVGASSGRVTARSVGTATIEAYYRGRLAASTMLTVAVPDAGMMMTDAGMTDAGMMADAGMSDGGRADGGM